MPLFNENQLKTSLTNNKLSKLYLIYGEETYLKNFYLNKLISAFVPVGLECFNLHIFNGSETDIDTILETAEALPVMSQYTCVVVKEYPFSQLNEQEFNIAKKALTELSESTTLIFIYNNIEVDTKKSSKWRETIRLFSKYGVAAELKKRPIGSIINLVTSGVKNRGGIISYDTAKYLISVCGDDLTNLLNEVDKLCSYANREQITKKMVDDICIKSYEASVFDLAKTIISNQPDKAFKILNNLINQKIPHQLLIGILASAYIDMYRVKLALKSKKKAADIATHFNYKNKEFRLENATTQSRYLDLAQLKYYINKLATADMLIKSSNLDNRIVLEQLLVELFQNQGVKL